MEKIIAREYQTLKHEWNERQRRLWAAYPPNEFFRCSTLQSRVKWYPDERVVVAFLEI